MLKVKITNPTAIGRSYAWLPGGLRLAPGESKVVPFDPFTAANKQVYVELCNRDLKLGFVTFTYIVEAPCKVDPTAIIDNEVAKPVELKETKKKAEKAKADPEMSTIKPVLDEVKPKEDAVPMFDGALGDTDTPAGKVEDPNVVKLFDRAKATVVGDFEVGAPKAVAPVVQEEAKEADQSFEVSVANEATAKKGRGRAKKVDI